MIGSLEPWCPCNRPVPIRPARGSDLHLMREIERAAGEAFRALGMDAVADDEPPGPPQLRVFVDDGRAWVAEHEHDGTVVGYLLAAVVDGCGHVEQVSVHPDHAGNRIGVALVDRAEEWSRERGMPALTLTTFRDVPWNGPYYARLGFRELAEPGPELRAIRDAEAVHGLDRWPRICMRRQAGDRFTG